MSTSEHDGEPAPRELSQGRVRRARRKQDLPWITITIIVACMLLAVAQRLQPQVTAELLFVPALAESQPYRYLTMGFIHADFWHLVFNMYALWAIGSFLERTLGRVRYLVLYLVSLFGGSAAIMLIASSTDQMSVGHLGASGAVFGLFGAYAILVRGFGRQDTGILVIIGLNLILSFVVPGISWQGHLGGLIAGSVLMVAWLQTRGKQRTTRALLDALLAVAVIAALIALISLS